jgi:ATP-dependent helicase/nuclease subunit A
VEEPSADRVRVMTIHKSKGLEFDAVVLPELDRPLPSRAEVLTDRPDPTGPIEAVYRYPKAETRALSPELTEAYRQWRFRQRQEDLCGLYVAMTRARQGLYLWVKPGRKPDGGPRSIGRCFAGVLRDTLGDPDEGALSWGQADWYTSREEQDRASAGDADVVAQATRIALAGRGEPRRLRPAVSPSALPEAGAGAIPGAGAVAELLALRPAGGRQRGTAWHEALAEIEYLGDDPPPGIAGELRQVLQRPAVRRALERRYEVEELWRERGFAVVIGGRLVRGTFDRVAVRRDAEGRATAAHLIDFKSDRIRDEETGLEPLVARYRPQIEMYVRALRKMLHLPASAVTAELLFLDPGTAVDLG